MREQSSGAFSTRTLLYSHLPLPWGRSHLPRLRLWPHEHTCSPWRPSCSLPLGMGLPSGPQGSGVPQALPSVSCGHNDLQVRRGTGLAAGFVALSPFSPSVAADRVSLVHSPSEPVRQVLAAPGGGGGGSCLPGGGNGVKRTQRPLGQPGSSVSGEAGQERPPTPERAYPWEWVPLPQRVFRKDEAWVIS